MKHLLEAHELGHLALHQPADGHARPLADDLGDFLQLRVRRRFGEADDIALGRARAEWHVDARADPDYRRELGRNPVIEFAVQRDVNDDLGNAGFHSTRFYLESAPPARL